MRKTPFKCSTTGFNQSSADEPATGVVFGRVADKAWLDGGDQTALDADVGRLYRVRKAHIADREVNGHARSPQPHRVLKAGPKELAAARKQDSAPEHCAVHWSSCDRLSNGRRREDQKVGLGAGP